MKRISGLLGAMFLAAGLTSCGGSAAGPGGGAGGGGGGGGGGGVCPTNVCMTVGNTFSPSSVTVTAGTTVTWTNDTGTTHNVTFADGVGSTDAFSTGTRSRAFTTPGTYTYTCTFHPPNMKGTIIVN
ncbi:MAG: cupredoxin domain-containing protein [Gemmatimonadaceae bacterium]